MDLKKYDENFIKKFQEEVEGKNFLYEYKTDEFQRGEVIGMNTTFGSCPNVNYEYKKDTTQEYIPIIEFYSEEGYRENDLQTPTLINC